MADFLFDEGKNKIIGMNRADITIALNSKADAQAVANAFQSVDTALNGKASTQQLNEAVNGLTSQIDKIYIYENIIGTTIKLENSNISDIVNVNYEGSDTLYMSNDDCAVLYDRNVNAVLPYKISKDDEVTFFIKDGSTLENSVRVNFIDENLNIIDYWSIKTTRHLIYDNVKTAFYVQINMNCPNGVVVRKGSSETIKNNYIKETITSGEYNLYDGETYFYSSGIENIIVNRKITPEKYTDEEIKNVNINIQNVDNKVDFVDEKTTINTQNILKIENDFNNFVDYSAMPIRIMDIDTTRPYLYGANENLTGKYKVVVDDDLFCRVVKTVNGSVEYISDWAKETEYEFEYNTINQFTFAKGTNYDQIITENDKTKIHLYRIEEKNTQKNRGILKPLGVHYIGHAGADISAPANSISGFKIAAQDNILWGIETDIRETSDGVLVCLHDSDISITTDGTGNINEMTYAESQQYTIDVGAHIEDFPNEKIPKFTEYLKECRRNCKVPVIEVKADIAINVDTLINNINECGLNENCIIQSFDYHTLLKCRTKGFKGVCFLIITGSVPKTDDEMARFFSQIGWIGNCGLNAYIPVSNIEHSNYLHNLGMLYGSWDTTIHGKNDIFGDLFSDVATISV